MSTRSPDFRQAMKTTVRRLAEQLGGIRPGAVSPGFLATIRVTTPSGSAPIGRLGALSAQGDRILITPFDPSVVPAVVKALADAKLNAYALNPRTVCVGIPPISGEGRAEISRHVRKLGEEAKIAVRAIRQEARKQIAARGRGSERAVQEATDAAVAEVERLVKAKEDEIQR
jgi:ribosome recycling factor